MDTLAQLLKRATQYIDLLDAELLLTHVLDTSREFLIANPDFKPQASELETFTRLVEKRQSGIPVSYLTGHKEFYGLDFLVNEHTLVPRPDTELMVELVLEKTKSLRPASWALIDVGTGSGCIPISIVKTIQQHDPSTSLRTNTQTIAADISPEALDIAQQNAKKHDVDINFFQGNLLEPVFNNAAMLQCNNLIITANLPYLTEEQFQNELSIQHEPKSALVAENDGLALYEELLGQIKKLITEHKLQVTGFFEIDPSQRKKLSSIIKTSFPDANIEVHKDLAGHDRITSFTTSL